MALGRSMVKKAEGGIGCGEVLVTCFVAADESQEIVKVSVTGVMIRFGGCESRSEDGARWELEEVRIRE